MGTSKYIGTWPTMQEYDRALQDRRRTVYDADIKMGDLMRDATGPMHLNGGGGKYVCVYQVSSWVVRCLTGHPPPDLNERYQAINAHLSLYPGKLPFLVSHTWIDRGIRVNGRDWPLIKLPYINGQPLGMFLADHYNDRVIVRSLSKQWLDMMQRLEAVQVAHGDLDVTNILVCGQSPNVSLRLIDFDGMYVPALVGYSSVDQGHEHFQPVNLKIRRFNTQMDRFSSLVIYLSLIAIAEDPTLWERCDADESSRLLLGTDDFQRLGISRNFALLLEKKRNVDLQKCLIELEDSIVNSRMPKSLSDILATQPNRPPVARPPTPKSVPLPLNLIQPSNPMGASSTPSPVSPRSASSPTSPKVPARRRSRPVLSQSPRRKPIRWLIAFMIIAVLVAMMVWILIATGYIHVPKQINPSGSPTSSNFLYISAIFCHSNSEPLG